MPICPELTRATLPRTQDVVRFLAITGTVIRATTVKMLEYEREFLCTKCKHVFTVSASKVCGACDELGVMVGLVHAPTHTVRGLDAG